MSKTQVHFNNIISLENELMLNDYNKYNKLLVTNNTYLMVRAKRAKLSLSKEHFTYQEQLEYDRLTNVLSRITNIEHKVKSL